MCSHLIGLLFLRFGDYSKLKNTYCTGHTVTLAVLPDWPSTVSLLAFVIDCNSPRVVANERFRSKHTENVRREERAFEVADISSSTDSLFFFNTRCVLLFYVMTVMTCVKSISNIQISEFPCEHQGDFVNASDDTDTAAVHACSGVYGETG